MKFCELMNVYDFASPLFVIDDERIVYNEIEDDLDPIFDLKELKNRNWYQEVKNHNAISFHPNKDTDTGMTFLMVYLNKSLLEKNSA